MNPPDPKRPVLDAQERVQRELTKDWETVRQRLLAFRAAAPDQRPAHLGWMLERLTPWLDRAIHAVELRFYVLAPREAVRERLFAQLAAGLCVPTTWDAVQIWIERAVLDELGSPGVLDDPSRLLCRSFNNLSFRQRALLYHYSLEGAEVTELAAAFQMSPEAVAVELRRLWVQVEGPHGMAVLPVGWRVPPAPAPPARGA